MKFMKLGSKPDLFQSEGDNVRFVSSELATDVIIIVDEVKFYLHKFPLLSKSYRLQRLILEANCEGTDKIKMNNFPGGPQAFEVCVKFCYGMTVTLSAYNVVAARCAAEYLEMTEDTEKGNLVYKIEVFLNSSVFRSWRDSIIVLQTTTSLLPWSSELKIEGRCIDSISSKSSVDPSSVHWSYTYNNKPIISDKIAEIQPKNSVPKDWWIEDLCELDVDLYKRTMVAIKARGRMSSDLIIEALRAYAMRWLADSDETLVSSDDCTKRNKYVVETLIWLLPSDKASASSCRFLLQLLNAVLLVDCGSFLEEELMNRVSAQLDKASVKDLLIPSRSSGETLYDVPLVQSLVKRFMVLERSVRDGGYGECENRAAGLVLGHASLVSVGKLVDGYLIEIGRDSKVEVSSFVELVQSLPDAARPMHDGLYAAVDVFLKGHPDLAKAEKKRICSLMDLKKLTPEASIHAAQNDRLPLRVVVQVLFFEQMRAASTAGTLKAATGSILNRSSRLTGVVEKEWEAPASEHCKSLEKQLRFLKVEEDDRRREIKNENEKDNKNRLLPSRSRRILEKFWVGKIQVGQNNRSSETSGSSQSPPTSATNPVASTTKSSGSSSRPRRHSVS
ncbi:BTB/POZ domain-containing protein NPY1-like [Phalaenopsis equestris]|uniref:BTB/POZ domain-containing protein NPY1-like n=1 Tax=Phalaenopsis equestris TaxID=78828 RepID=UPI0009E31672|nr:BTB/POZ domain-containing protein NPY1-like [Phalaenopsis equestris]